MSEHENRDGLRPQDHGDLNTQNLEYPGGAEARERRLNELRISYSGDPKALQQIDVYDGLSPYNVRKQELRQAILSDDREQEDALMNWFKENYPDIR